MGAYVHHIVVQLIYAQILTVDANAVRYCVDPRKERFAGTIGMAHAVDAKPQLLEQVIGIGPAAQLRGKEAMQPRAEPLDEDRRTCRIGLLVPDHQFLEVRLARLRSSRISFRLHAFPLITLPNESRSSFPL